MKNATRFAVISGSLYKKVGKAGVSVVLYDDDSENHKVYRTPNADLEFDVVYDSYSDETRVRYNYEDLGAAAGKDFEGALENSGFVVVGAKVPNKIQYKGATYILEK